MKKLLTLSVVLIFCLSHLYSTMLKTKHETNNILILSGELSPNSIILQCRLNKSDKLINSDIPGVKGNTCFQISTDSTFKDYIKTKWQECTNQNDYITKIKVDGLQSETTYFYRAQALISGSSDTVYSKIGTFSTLPPTTSEKEMKFAMSSGFHYEKFYGFGHYLKKKKNPLLEPAKGIDSILGFEAFDAVREMDLDFFIANGDVVYYDHPRKMPVKTKPQLNAKWHRYFAMPRNRDMCLQLPVYYLKDDHDHRFNDCDTTNIIKSEPSSQLGIQVFKEQVPVTDPADDKAVTYRTYKMGKHLQLWFVEGRDYRSPNNAKDTLDKTIWGEEQKRWLKETLLESNARFKILVSPTPMVGPDDIRKTDNHTNVGGFQTEGNEFFQWLKENDFDTNEFFIICGDRHWQYHSIHPYGYEEFSGGAFINQNSRKGKAPGNKNSTDPDGLITSPFMQIKETGGGFLVVNTHMEKNIPVIRFSFHDIHGKERYATVKK